MYAGLIYAGAVVGSYLMIHGWFYPGMLVAVVCTIIGLVGCGLATKEE